MSRQTPIAARRLVLASAALAAATACRSDGPIGPQTLPGPRAPSAPEAIAKPKPTLYFNGILFQGSHDETTGELYSMNPDGTGIYRLTSDSVPDAYPDVSPVGPAFVWARFSADGQTSEIYSQNLDGTKRKKLTSLGTVAITPRYSPNGQQIAFAAVVPGVGSEIFTMNADGTGVARLTYSGRNSVAPSWSPDGSRIAFQSADSAGFPGVWTMYASGGQQKLLATCPPPGCAHPKWSPVADEIAVEHIDMTGIIVISATTGGKIGYIPSTPTAYDMTPTWSKDGTRIIFSSLRSGNGTYDIYSTEPVRRGDSALPPIVRLTTLGPGDEMTPAYSH